MKKIGEKFQKNINAPARPHQHVNWPIGSGSSSTVPNHTNRSPSQPKTPSKPNPRQSVAVALAAVGERLWESMAGLQWNLNARKKKALSSLLTSSSAISSPTPSMPTNFTAPPVVNSQSWSSATSSRLGLDLDEDFRCGVER